MAFDEILIALAQPSKKIDRRQAVKFPICPAIALSAGKHEICHTVNWLTLGTKVELIGEKVVDISQVTGKRVECYIPIAVETPPLLISVQSVS